MDVTVSCRHIDLSPGQRELVQFKIGKLDRIVGGMDRAEVHFTEERNPRISEREVCEVTMDGHGHRLVAKVAATDPMAAMDLAIEKLENQLQTLKSRLMAHHHGKAHKAAPPPGPGAAAG
jgi:putative sigma-54 modulation protein